MSGDATFLTAEAVVDDGTPVVPPCRSARPAMAVIRISGDDAADFLHGQFSADMRALAAGHSVLTAWCSPKGRVLFLPRLLRAASGPYFALLPANQSASFIKRLRMFVLRAKVAIEDCSVSHGVLVLDGVDAPPPDADVMPALDGERCWLVGPRDQLARLWDSLLVPAQGPAAALLTDIARGQPLLDVALTDQFLPQELNLDALAGVSFNKGCYPGQEIIARVKFRGAVKRRVQRIVIATAVAPLPGARLVSADDALGGTVLLAAAQANGTCAALAVIDANSGPLYLAATPGASVEVLPLPYALDGA